MAVARTAAAISAPARSDQPGFSPAPRRRPSACSRPTVAWAPRPGPTYKTSPWERFSGLVDDAVDELADAFDLHDDLVAGLHPQRRITPCADAAGGARDDDVAGTKLGP